MTMHDARWRALMRFDTLELTPEEIKAGWHFCPDWDGLLIGPGMMEVEVCCCQNRLGFEAHWHDPTPPAQGGAE